MNLKRRQYTTEFKLHVLHEVEAGKPLAQAAREHQLHPNLIYKWRERLAKQGKHAFKGNAQDSEAKVAHLERLIGQLTVENTFLKNVLAHREARQNEAR